jgi:hypothetical protein
MSLTVDDMKMIGEEFERALKPIYQWQGYADKQFTAINRRLDEMQSTFDAHSASLMKIENTLGVYAEAEQLNQEETKKLDTRVSVIEDHLGLPSPADHSLD